MPVLFLALLLADAPAREWHQWRGPLATGEAPDASPPLTWDAKTNVAWKTPLPGRGSASPVVAGDRVFVLTSIDTGTQADPKDLPRPDPRFAASKKTQPPTTYHEFVALALDRATGKVLWKTTCARRVPHEGHHHTHSYAAGSPATDGRRVVACFGSFGLFCLDLDGKILWRRQLGRMETRFGWGEAVTPVLHGGRVYLTFDHEADSFVACYDAKDGKELWKTPREEPSSWATPRVVEHKGTTHVIAPGTKRVRGYDASTGKVLWHHPGLTVNCIPTPVVKDGVAFVMSGYTGAVAYAVPLDVRGDATGKAKWKLEKGTPYVPSPVLVGDRLYFTQTNDPLLTCIDVATGKAVLDRARLPGVRSFYASPVAAAGRLYFVDRDGTTLVLAAEDKARVLATNRLGEAVDASPALAGRQLFLRGEKHLWCLAEPAK